MDKQEEVSMDDDVEEVIANMIASNSTVARAMGEMISAALSGIDMPVDGGRAFMAKLAEEFKEHAEGILASLKQAV